jgi:DNA-binding transcriptional LysR family regulator
VRLPHAPEDREFEHLFYMLEAAAAGLGVGLSPWIYVAGDIASGRLAAPYGFVPTPARFFLLLPAGPPKTAAAAFREWLVEEAAAAPAPPTSALQIDRTGEKAGTAAFPDAAELVGRTHN